MTSGGPKPRWPPPAPPAQGLQDHVGDAVPVAGSGDQAGHEEEIGGLKQPGHLPMRHETGQGDLAASCIGQLIAAARGVGAVARQGKVKSKASCSSRPQAARRTS